MLRIASILSIACLVTKVSAQAPQWGQVSLIHILLKVVASALPDGIAPSLTSIIINAYSWPRRLVGDVVQPRWLRQDL
ncbi:hypothetical protein BDZ94DRAFT_1252855 [Collybia nuda]|uniref:Uncharacterized protein n=1 Tax=Collybia nuda TaxID=64659 RepID=A0A9P6CMF5_9AGAR|nr:hypothetical protein BDZ94DRAFT_1252855 [Collybia nuda]